MGHRLDFVKIFVESTSVLFKELVGPSVDVPSIASDQPCCRRGRGDYQAYRKLRVSDFDMDLFTAVQLAGHMMGEPSPGLTPLVRSSIAELASMAIGRAISRINDQGTRLRMSPPTVITGANLVSYDQCFETLVAPINTAYGEVRVNVTIQDLD
jgi:hypothetical protein